LRTIPAEFTVLTAALMAVGCVANPCRELEPHGHMLALGGLFWRKVTPAYRSRGAGKPIVTIPNWSVCDVREFGGGWCRVKVLLGEAWQVLWVRDLPVNHVGIAHHPYLTFGYYSFGAEASPDFDWPRTADSLLAEAKKQRGGVTHEELVALFGAQMVDESRQQLAPAHRE